MTCRVFQQCLGILLRTHCNRIDPLPNTNCSAGLASLARLSETPTAVTLNLYDAMVRQMTGMHFAVQTFALVSLKLNNRSIHLVHCSDVQTDTVHC